MASSLKLEDLPLDAIEQIAICLSVSDLSNCCSVSHSWRYIFGDDLFWKKRCYKEVVDYLKSTSCQLESSFCGLPKDFILSPVSKWRLSYMYENHLWNNWRSGQYVSEEIQFDIKYTLKYVSAEFFENDFVLLHTKTRTQVWNVKKKPFLCTTIKYYFPDLKTPDFFKITKDKFIVMQFNIVKVFDISILSKHWPLSFIFFFDKCESFSSNITEKTDLSSMMISTSDYVHTTFVVSENLFVGIVKNQESLIKPIMHIWNIRTGKKVKEQALPPYSNIISIFLSKSETTSDILVDCCLRIDAGNVVSTVIHSFIYSITNMDFLPFSLRHQGYSVLAYNYLYILDNSQFCIYNYHSTKLIFQQSDLSAENFILKLVRRRAVVSCNEDMMLIDPDRRDGDITFNVGFLFWDFNIVSEKFVAVRDCDINYSDIWEIKKNPTKVLSHPGKYLSVNKSCSKLLLESYQKLFVLNFW